MYKPVAVQEPQHRDDFLRCEFQPFPEFSALTHIAALPTNSSARGKLDADVLCQTLWLTTKSHSSNYSMSCRVDRRLDWLITNTKPGTCSAVWSTSFQPFGDLPKTQNSHSIYFQMEKWMDVQIVIILHLMKKKKCLHLFPKGFKEYGWHLDTQNLRAHSFLLDGLLFVVRLTSSVETSGIPDNRPDRSNRRRRVSHQLWPAEVEAHRRQVTSNPVGLFCFLHTFRGHWPNCLIHGFCKSFPKMEMENSALIYSRSCREFLWVLCGVGLTGLFKGVQKLFWFIACICLKIEYIERAYKTWKMNDWYNAFSKSITYVKHFSGLLPYFSTLNGPFAKASPKLCKTKTFQFHPVLIKTATQASAMPISQALHPKTLQGWNLNSPAAVNCYFRASTTLTGWRGRGNLLNCIDREYTFIQMSHIST